LICTPAETVRISEVEIPPRKLRIQSKVHASKNQAMRMRNLPRGAGPWRKTVPNDQIRLRGECSRGCETTGRARLSRKRPAREIGQSAQIEGQRRRQAYAVREIGGERPHQFTGIQRRVELHHERGHTISSDQIHTGRSREAIAGLGRFPSSTGNDLMASPQDAQHSRLPHRFDPLSRADGEICKRRRSRDHAT